LSALPDSALNGITPGPIITLVGAGAASTIIDANQLDRVLNVSPNRTPSVSGVTLRDGVVSGGNGGGVRNAGTLTVTNSLITANITQGGGGGVANYGLLTLIRSTLSANQAADGGGADNGAGLTLIQSTVSGNTASRNGGGLH